MYRFARSRRVLLFAVAVAIGMALPLATPAFGPGTARAQEDALLQPNLDNILLEDFLQFVGTYTGRSIVYRSDQIPKTRFKVYSKRAISEPELMAIFHRLLENVGLQAVTKGEAMYVMPLGQAKKLPPTVAHGSSLGSGSEEELVVTVYQLYEGLGVKNAVALLKGMQSPLGTVQAVPQADAVLLRDKRETIEDMVKVLELVREISPEWELDIYPLKSADAQSVATTLSSMFTELAKQGRSESVPLVRPVTWSNSVLFAGNLKQKDMLVDLLSRLDNLDEAASGLKIFRLRNANASSVATVLSSLIEVIQGQGEQAKKKTVSDMFKVTADADTNSLIVVCNKDVMAQIEEIVDKLDQAQDQVFVEALIMETSLDNAREIGVEWLVGAGDDNNLGTFGFTGTSSSSSLASYVNPVITDNEAPDVTSLASGFNMGVLGNIINFGDSRFPTLSSLISYVKSVDEINILSTPQIMTLDNAEAEIFIGENRAFRTGTISKDSSTETTYEFKDVGIELKVTPHINSEDGLIRLEVEQTVDKVKEVSGEGLPVTLSRYAKTTVQLLDGSTMVIGGLVEENSEKGRQGMPGLANIPVLGWMFKSEAKSQDKATIMIFVSAHIVRSLEQVDKLTTTKMGMVEEAAKNAKRLFETQFDMGGDDADMDQPSPESAMPERVTPASGTQGSN